MQLFCFWGGGFWGGGFLAGWLVGWWAAGLRENTVGVGWLGVCVWWGWVGGGLWVFVFVLSVTFALLVRYNSRQFFFVLLLVLFFGGVFWTLLLFLPLCLLLGGWGWVVGWLCWVLAVLVLCCWGWCLLLLVLFLLGLLLCLVALLVCVCVASLLLVLVGWVCRFFVLIGLWVVELVLFVLVLFCLLSLVVWCFGMGRQLGRRQRLLCVVLWVFRVLWWFVLLLFLLLLCGGRRLFVVIWGCFYGYSCFCSRLFPWRIRCACALFCVSSTACVRGGCAGGGFCPLAATGSWSLADSRGSCPVLLWHSCVWVSVALPGPGWPVRRVRVGVAGPAPHPPALIAVLFLFFGPQRGASFLYFLLHKTAVPLHEQQPMNWLVKPILIDIPCYY